MRRVLFVVLVVFVAALVSCAKSSAIRDASIDELHDALGKPGTVLIDVRRGAEMQNEMKFIEGAAHLPLHTLQQNLDRISKNSNIYLISNDHGDTVTAANILADAGYPFIYRVTETFDEYVAKYPQK